MATKTQKQDMSLVYIALARISLGFIMLWAFLDKTFGLGFATCRDAKTGVMSTMCSDAWINGGSPTTGFLQFASKGPLAPLYQSMAGNNFVDILFMAGLLLIGIALIAGIGIKLASAFGSLMMLLMWSATLLPENNPILDEHIIYILLLLIIVSTNKKQKLGLRGWWIKQPLVKKMPILE